MIYGKFYSHSLKKNMRQVRKDTAKREYEKFQTVYLLASNMMFDCVWSGLCPINKERENWGENFESICNSFSYYNCDGERGKRILFFVED